MKYAQGGNCSLISVIHYGVQTISMKFVSSSTPQKDTEKTQYHLWQLL